MAYKFVIKAQVHMFQKAFLQKKVEMPHLWSSDVRHMPSFLKPVTYEKVYIFTFHPIDQKNRRLSVDQYFLLLGTALKIDTTFLTFHLIYHISNT
jgi:hypothetical protein